MLKSQLQSCSTDDSHPVLPLHGHYHCDIIDDQYASDKTTNHVSYTSGIGNLMVTPFPETADNRRPRSNPATSGRSRGTRPTLLPFLWYSRTDQQPETRVTVHPRTKTGSTAKDFPSAQDIGLPIDDVTKIALFRVTT